ncbi:hypothetical protein [Marinomonas colpomeniae]|uniref:Uncharacterized protein n=1 Tax=Marinomonas colpomeniae TaxID=2774408 RepID=A0ABR8P5H9_9GAMM|nr:hypothetical protein [Marinomonas colpomeniae]MBD5772732.1 hypothetical protein [Marinomonas colpomeniae]
MKKNIIPLATALIFAVAIHILLITLSNNRDSLDANLPTPSFELILLPEVNRTTNDNAKSAESNNPTIEQFISEQQAPPLDTSVERPLIELGNFSAPDPISFAEPQTLTDNLNSGNLTIEKADLLDLSNLDLSPDKNDGVLEEVFSEELRNKIAESTLAQENYLKGQMKEEEYPVTKGVDGSRYVNINGVCWRVPDMGSNDLWAVVLSGCSGQSKTFLFELNIAPNVFLGTDSPFFIGK